ncbi:citrate lyase subunit alpha [Acidaminobacter hydrogenoformans]|uniref:Citrate lyase alpha chain n=1 Tax=Acidaminobacter hydrogenoformans DSM 2784 TaxID=1120920 RepID=A0A1G5S064_9FIRM|nr:citrate lyase subunit alpha [Acidaminobacter hydrogenoformans]SCZ79646.1 citrate lyase subunit alpha / citrate CoA-transferase [Acidaminobacter hydrogenoformans DSM 2784]
MNSIELEMPGVPENSSRKGGRRPLPESIEGYGEVRAFEGAFAKVGVGAHAHRPRVSRSVRPGQSKLLASIDEALERADLADGKTLSFHHHLRNGDYVLNLVMEAVAKRGVKGLTLAVSSIFPVHEPLVALMDSGVVTGLATNYMSGPVAKAVSQGRLKTPAVMMTHGGRPRAIETGDLKIDIAFIAAPCADAYGNCNGLHGKSACGALGYAVADAQYADVVVAVTDDLVPYPASPAEITQTMVDYVVAVPSIGDPQGIVSGTTRITRDPVGLAIAHKAAQVIEASGLLVDGFSFQTGAGGTSLAVAAELKDMMKTAGIVGSFAAGGITGYLVDMLEEGLFRNLLDVQCFDLRAVQSYRDNPRHLPMDASMYANPFSKGTVVNQLDVMILGATEIDLDFNVNVTTGSDGTIMGGSGGHSDTAAGAKLAMVVTQLVKARLPIVRRHVTTITTPGETVDVLVTDHGIAVNPVRQDLAEALRAAGLEVVAIQDLLAMAESMTGIPDEMTFSDDIVAVVEYRDGTVIDVVRKTK